MTCARKTPSCKQMKVNEEADVERNADRLRVRERIESHHSITCRAVLSLVLADVSTPTSPSVSVPCSVFFVCLVSGSDSFRPPTPCDCTGPGLTTAFFCYPLALIDPAIRRLVSCPLVYRDRSSLGKFVPLHIHATIYFGDRYTSTTLS